MRSVSLVLVVAVTSACATPASRTSEAVSVPGPALSMGAPLGTRVTGAVVPASAESAASGPRLCGCGLCEPLPSADACKSDADCAPEGPCHAKACVAQAKSKGRTQDVMCTQDIQCATADVNACGCVKGVCALFKRP